MAVLGLSDVLSVLFAGIIEMLSGKNFALNVRAFKMIAEEILSLSMIRTLQRTSQTS